MRQVCYVRTASGVLFCPIGDKPTWLEVMWAEGVVCRTEETWASCRFAWRAMADVGCVSGGCHSGVRPSYMCPVMADIWPLAAAILHCVNVTRLTGSAAVMGITVHQKKDSQQTNYYVKCDFILILGAFHGDCLCTRQDVPKRISSHL